MRLILLSVLTYACGDDAKFFQATGKVKEKKVAKVQAVEPAPELTSEPQIEPEPEEKTESEFCPATSGDFSEDERNEVRDYWEKKAYPQLSELRDDWYVKFRICAAKLNNHGIMEFMENVVKSWSDHANITYASTLDLPQQICQTYFFQKEKLWSICQYYNANCSHLDSRQDCD